ncbi:MAG: MFS transporter, partial [Janthinobacterium lividum]
MTAPTTSPPAAGAGIFSRAYLVTTLGMASLVFLAAFESLAVTTVMPIVSVALDGRGSYATAFSATLAASVLGMVAAGGWADRRGPGRPLVAAVAIFAFGLLGAALAPSMEVFLAARFVQGLGSGGISVTLYVTVALVYPQRLRPAVFGVFASAWVIPSLVGPLLAGFVAATFGWPWVFAGVLGLVLLAAAPVLPVLLRMPANATSSTESDGVSDGVSPSTRTRYGAAFVVAAAVVVLSSAGAVGAWRWVLAVAALLVLAVGVRPLLPRGTLRARTGLPATVLLRGSIAATFYSTEVYLPLMLHERFGLPLWAPG